MGLGSGGAICGFNKILASASRSACARCKEICFLVKESAAKRLFFDKSNGDVLYIWGAVLTRNAQLTLIARQPCSSRNLASDI